MGEQRARSVGSPPPPCFAWSPSPVNGRGVPTAIKMRRTSQSVFLSRAAGEGNCRQAVEGAAACAMAARTTASRGSTFSGREAENSDALSGKPVVAPHAVTDGLDASAKKHRVRLGSCAGAL
jgi:hypothetical protein